MEDDRTMLIEDMPLTNEDKDRIRKCLAEPTEAESMISNLLIKHTVSND